MMYIGFGSKLKNEIENITFQGDCGTPGGQRYFLFTEWAAVRNWKK